MSNGKNNPGPFVVAITTDTKGKVTVQPNYTIAIAPKDVGNNLMHLTGVEKYSFTEYNGKIYRVTEQGKVIGPPIKKEKFEKIKKVHEEYLEK